MFIIISSGPPPWMRSVFSKKVAVAIATAIEMVYFPGFRLLLQLPLLLKNYSLLKLLTGFANAAFTAL